MKKNILIYLLLFVSIIFVEACSTCETRESSVIRTFILEFALTVSDSNNASFETIFDSIDNRGGFTPFNFESIYNLPETTPPVGTIHFEFIFNEASLPNMVNIFDQLSGSSLDIGESVGQVYDGDLVVYQESNLDGLMLWSPTSYNGVVSFSEDSDGNRIVEFDVIFSNGVESRQVQASYNFLDGGTFVRETGECG